MCGSDYFPIIGRSLAGQLWIFCTFILIINRIGANEENLIMRPSLPSKHEKFTQQSANIEPTLDECLVVAGYDGPR